MSALYKEDFDNILGSLSLSTVVVRQFRIVCLFWESSAEHVIALAVCHLSVIQPSMLDPLTWERILTLICLFCQCIWRGEAS